MTIWGINIFDILIVFIFFVVLIWIGAKTTKDNKNTQDFFLAGRKLNKMYQFFLNFGCSTHADQTVAVTREIYRQGIGGMWIQFLVLFLTPFYWFTTFFFRRVRLVTIGDFFSERFRSRFLGAAYAVFFVLMSVLGGGVGYIVAAKTVMAMTPKPFSELLMPGAIGLMLAGILAATMSSLGASSVSYSALFIRNIYQPFFHKKSERHYIFTSRIIIALTLLGGIGVALYLNNLLELFKYIISIPAIFGASVWLGFIWRRLTKWAVIVQVTLCLIIYAIIPNLFMQIDGVKNNQKFLLETDSKQVIVTTAALQSDVAAGRAEKVGQLIKKNHIIEPVGIFFESVARTNPDDPASPKAGLGRFQAEIWIMSWFGIDFTSWSKPQLTAARFFFDALFPFLILFLVSFLTRPDKKNHLSC
jgi:Na+/proline symporter